MKPLKVFKPTSVNPQAAGKQSVNLTSAKRPSVDDPFMLDDLFGIWKNPKPSQNTIKGKPWNKL